MLIPVDLHCHTTHSDGSHTTEEVFQFIEKNNGKYIAITDHDTIAGLPHANAICNNYNLSVINGVEISVTWEKDTLIHILGLGIDYTNQELINNLANLRNQRIQRGHDIAKKLENYGIKNAFEGAMQYCAYPESLSRTHFAKFLVANGHAKQNNVFNKFLAPNKIAYVKQQWAELQDAINWINNSGGVAIIAHPARYRLGHTKLEQLIVEFKLCGGRGIEVYSSSHDERDINTIANLSVKYNLLATGGNDFHNIKEYPKLTVGLIPELPTKCITIFETLGIKLA
jgi:predicted metal-dependent phosphoesterase TrpH